MFSHNFPKVSKYKPYRITFKKKKGTKAVTLAIPFQKVHFCTLRVNIGTFMVHNGTNMYHEGTNINPLGTKPPQ